MRFEIHPDLSFGESVYDALNQLTQTRQFDFKLSSNVPRTEAEMVALRGNRVVGDGVTRGQVHAYDAAGRLTSTVDALNNIERYEYNALGDRTRWIDKNGAAWTYDYDRKGQKIKETSPPMQFKLSGEALGTPAPNRVLENRFAYDAFGNLIRRSRPRTSRTTREPQTSSTTLWGGLRVPSITATTMPATGRVERDPGVNRFRQEATHYLRYAGQHGAYQHPHRRERLPAHVSDLRQPRSGGARNQCAEQRDALHVHVVRRTGDGDTLQRDDFGRRPRTGCTGLRPKSIRSSIGVTTRTGTCCQTPMRVRSRMAYDKLGRKILVTQPTATYYSTHTPGDASQANYYRPNAPGYVAGVQDAAVTRYEYNAFGDLTLQRRAHQQHRRVAGHVVHVRRHGPEDTQC